MGQGAGKSPLVHNRQDELVNERWRVLKQSAELLARADEHVNAGESLLLEHTGHRLAGKVDRWLDAERARIATAATVVGRADYRLASLEKALAELGDEMNRKMRRDYEMAYKDLSGFAKALDKLAERQRKIHKKILDLEELWPREPTKFRRKLARLRVKVFKNSCASEKMLFHDRRLQKQFVKKVYDIDQENMEYCRKKVEQIIRDL